MNLAVMQPYLFPYIGYFQLIYASDTFLIYDDVSYIKQGFINRNTVLSKNGPVRFTIPVPGASSNTKISSLYFSNDAGSALKTIEQSYSKSPYFDTVFPLIEAVITSTNRNIADVCLNCYESVFKYLGLNRTFLKTSQLEYDRNLTAKDRLIALCHKFGAANYINAPGGKKLYSRDDFQKEGVNLQFINPRAEEYSQRSKNFTPNLSIIDILMNCSPAETRRLIRCYELD